MSLGSFFGRLGDIIVEGIEQVAVPVATQVAVSRIQEKQLRARARRAQPASGPGAGILNFPTGPGDFGPGSVTPAGFITGSIGEEGLSLSLGPGAGPGGGAVAGLPAMMGAGGAFKPVRSSMTGQIIGYRAKSIVPAINPGSGTMTYFRHVGQPVLFAGDARICRAVRKKARKALSASGGR